MSRGVHRAMGIGLLALGAACAIGLPAAVYTHRTPHETAVDLWSEMILLGGFTGGLFTLFGVVSLKQKG
ncbi:uncharacterized protein SOCE26_019180 [Sorangium cellulosum]|uniref:Uncharacterized protein n=1 Tax=Sorangium cellulosum TaxID=56 RepID=A0A2L0EMJ2_SORCE|nr:hypothetical protein [Sorangium cellulosum]AUX40517.1 uncharacterized protein SOCE26_019180 [Sorangium cellulosum]